MKHFHFAPFFLNAHQAAHWPQKMKTDNLKFRTDLQDLVIEKYGWLFCNTLDDCLQRQIAQKFLKSKIETLPVSAGHCIAFKYLRLISFATNGAAKQCKLCFLNHIRHCLQAFASCHLNLLCFQFESEQTPISQTGHWFWFAALHRLWNRTCWFVPTSYFNSETNGWWKYWAKQWVLLWSVTTSLQFHWKFHFTW